METNPPGTQYHPDFPDCPSGADVVVTLVSRERTLFSVSANVLKAASRVFETTLALPQPEESASSHPVIDNLDESATTIEGLLRMSSTRLDNSPFLHWIGSVYTHAWIQESGRCIVPPTPVQPEESASPHPVIDNLDESATTIEGLLRMIMAKEFPPLDTMEIVEPLVLAAEKWEMPGPLSMLKMVLLRDSSFAEKHPIRLYWLGCRLKWVALQDLAAKFTCNDDIYYHKVLDSMLDTMDPGDVLRLVRFHRTRRDRMREDFDGAPWDYTIYTSNPQCQELRMKFLEYMDSKPPGRPLLEGELRPWLPQEKREISQGDRGRGQWRYESLVSELMEEWKALPKKFPHISSHHQQRLSHVGITESYWNRGLSVSLCPTTFQGGR